MLLDPNETGAPSAVTEEPPVGVETPNGVAGLPEDEAGTGFNPFPGALGRVLDGTGALGMPVVTTDGV